MGFQYSYYFSLMLLDVFSISEMLQDIVKCMTLPGTKAMPSLNLLRSTTSVLSRLASPPPSPPAYAMSPVTRAQE